MTIKSYVLSVLGVVLISQLAEMILPDGKMKQTVKTVFMLITAMVFISPVVQFASGGINFESYVSECEISTDEYFSVHVASVREKNAEEACVQALNKAGYYGVLVDVSTKNEAGICSIENVSINLKNLVIIGEGQHINNSVIAEIVATTLNVENGSVIVVG